MLRDIRRAPFCWQDKHALRILRAHYDGERLKQRATALAVYLALTELASDQYQQDRVEVVHRAIWEATGTSESTVKRYLKEFVEIGLIAVEHRKLDQEISLPNIYTLLTPGSTGEPTPSTNGLTPGSTHEPTGSANGHLLEELNVKKDHEEDDTKFLRRMKTKYKLAERDLAELVRRHTVDGSLRQAALWGELASRKSAR
jgi:DNA-binding MarR family transcriptional regulator